MKITYLLNVFEFHHLLIQHGISLTDLFDIYVSFIQRRPFETLTCDGTEKIY